MKRFMLICSVAFFPAIAQAQSNDVPVYVGNHGQINATSMGCPTKQDGETFISSLVSATNANDQVGKEQAVETALGAGCFSFSPGDTGLVINVTGFLDIWYEIRMDKDENVYWFPANVVSPIPGQPNNPPG